MSQKVEVTVDEFYDRVQEETDKITQERNEPRIEVIRYPKAELRKGVKGCFRGDPKLCLPILEEAWSKASEKYALKTGE